MAGVNFFETPTTDPNQLMAMQLMKQGQVSPQGQTVNGHYVAPTGGAYAGQMANALGGGYKMNQMQEAAHVQDILNGGTGAAAQNGFSKIGGWLGGMFGGAA